MPPDLERLQAIHAYIAQLQTAHGTVGTFLDVLAAVVDADLAAAAPAGPPDGYRLQSVRATEGRAVLHRGDCWITDGYALTRDEALMTLTDDVTRNNLDLCTACRPEETLEP